MDFTHWLQSLTDKGGELALTYGVRVLGVIAVLVIGRWVARSVGKAVNKSLAGRQVDQVLVQFGGNLARYAVLTFVGLICLELFGIETMSFVAVLGAAGLAVGLALQGTLSHFAAGVMLVLFRPFKIGEVVNTADVTGQVEKLGLFATTLITSDNKTVTVPNGKIWGSTIQNLSDRAYRRVDVAVGISYDAELDKAQETMLNAIRTLPGVLATPEPQVYLKELGASSVDFELRCFTTPGDYWKVRELMVRACKKALDSARIGIPYPQLDLHVDAGSLPLLSNKTSAPQKQPGIA